MAIRFSARTIAGVTTAGLANVIVGGALLAPADAGLLGPSGPVAPTSTQATVNGTTATVRWTTPTEPSGAWITVDAIEPARGVVGTRACFGCTSLAWDGLRGGQTYAFAVRATTTSAQSTAITTAPVSVAEIGACAGSATCVSIDATQSLGAVAHPASGFLHSISQSTPPALIAAVHPTSWRVQASNVAQIAAADASGAVVQQVLSDAWWGHTYTAARGTAASPWSSWLTYSSWVQYTVRAAEAAGQAPAYWDIQNEPETKPYYDPAAPATPSLVLQQYLTAYNAIKSVDANAKVVAPSIDWAFNQPGWPVDLRRFIDYAAANNMKVDALSWHENGDGDGPATRPEAIADHVATVRQYLTRYPALGNPPIIINEYAGASSALKPGWLVSYFASIGSAGVQAADHSCFHGCFDADDVLDGTITPSGATTEAYWTYVRYADLSGQRVRTGAADDHVNAVAAVAGDGSVHVLVGRDDACVAAGNGSCGGGTPADTKVVITVPAGWTSAQVSGAVLPDDLLLTDPTPLASSVVPVVGGIATITVPALDDGGAASLVVRPV
ncbi:MAG TPA: hypothetical protein VHE83_13575 [Mycobacteriales bacterium]|nr:hypothetical protein [Mycobacteriales bacterium]